MVGDFATLCSGKHGIVSPHDGPVPSRRVPARPATRVLGELKSIGEELDLSENYRVLFPEMVTHLMSPVENVRRQKIS